MATVNEKMTTLADAIREKTGTTEPLSLDQMAIEVMTIENNGEVTEQPAYLDKAGLQRVWANAANRFASKGHLSVTSLDANGQTPAGQTPDTSSIPVTSVIPAEAEIWIDPNDESTEESHVYNKNNPHRVTAEQTGAAKIQHAQQHSWSDTLTWDGDTTGKVVYDSYDDGTWLFYHISDAVPTKSDFANGYAVTYWDNVEGEEVSYYVSAYVPNEEEDPWFNPDGAVFDTHIAIVPIDNYEYDELTFPKKGIYFMRNTYNGEDSIVTSLTIPGYVFESGSDPITLDMINAAPAYHAATDARHGVGTKDYYGHFRYADLFDTNYDPGIFRFDENNNLIDKDGNIVEEPLEYLKGYATGAHFSYVFYSIMCLEIEGLNQEIAELNNEIRALKGE